MSNAQYEKVLELLLRIEKRILTLEEILREKGGE